MPIDGDITANKLDVQGVIPYTRTVTTPGIFLQVGTFIVGKIQSVTENQSRGATEIYEMGSVGPVDIVYGQPKYTLAITKMKIYRQSLVQAVSIEAMKAKDATLYTKLSSALQNGATKVPSVALFRNLSHFAFPFDIKVIEISPSDNKMDTTIYNGVVITSYSRPSTIGGGLTVSETVNASCLNITYQETDTNTWTS